MIQGQTLDAAFADAQEVQTTPSSEIHIASYIGLSRVKEMQNIWVLQPFSPLIFRQGAPKGPAILMQKLRGEITADQAANAAAEHVHDEAECKKSSGKFDITKQQFMCLECYWSGEREYTHHAAAFGVRKPSDLLWKLLMHGDWTRCERCQKTHTRRPLESKVAPENAENDLLQMQALHHTARIEAGMEKLQCVACHEEKMECEYYQSIWRLRRREHRRCRDCFTCPTCAPGTKHSLADFVHGSKICKTCATTLTCVVCKQAKLKTAYPDAIWNNQKTRMHHRCHGCFVCPKCPPEKVHTLYDFKLGAAICKRCDTLTCSACKKEVEQHLCRRRRDGSVALCQACVELGCTMEDTALYRCHECFQALGGQRFQHSQLKNFKYHPQKIVSFAQPVSVRSRNV